jgi:hypothetical protein
LFHQDAATIRRELGRQNLPSSPERCIFGLPHNYSRFERDASNSVPAGTRAGYFQFKADIDPAGEAERRASPLLLHIHETTSGEVVAVWMLFESAFLPEELEGRDLSVVVKRSFLGRTDERNQTERRPPWFPVGGTNYSIGSDHEISLPISPDYGAAHDFLNKFT